MQSLEDVVEHSSPSEGFREAYRDWVENNPTLYKELLEVTELWMNYINDPRAVVSQTDIGRIAYDRMWLSFYTHVQIASEDSSESAEALLKKPVVNLDMYRYCLKHIDDYIAGEPEHAVNMARCAYVRLRKHFNEFSKGDLKLLLDWLPLL